MTRDFKAAKDTSASKAQVSQNKPCKYCGYDGQFSYSVRSHPCVSHGEKIRITKARNKTPQPAQKENCDCKTDDHGNIFMCADCSSKEMLGMLEPKQAGA